MFGLRVWNRCQLSENKFASTPRPTLTMARNASKNLPNVLVLLSTASPPRPAFVAPAPAKSGLGLCPNGTAAPAAAVATRSGFASSRASLAHARSDSSRYAPRIEAYVDEMRDAAVVPCGSGRERR